MERTLILLWIILSCWNISAAQKLIFRNFTVEDGIAQSNANDIIQDDDGYIWFATQKGVCRFDGKEFVTLSENDGLISNITQCLTQDHTGAIWIGARFGLSRYQNQTFENFTVNDGLPSHLINDICEDENKNIWVATEKGVSKYTPQGFETLSFDKPVEVIFCDPGNGLWLGSTDGLYFYDGGEVKKTEIIPDLSVTDIVKDTADNLWASTEYGVYRYDGDSTVRFTTSNGLRSDKIEDLLVDSRGALWMASEGRGISTYDGVGFTHYDYNNGLINQSIFKIFEDYENNIWIGGRNGLTLFNRRVPFSHYEFDENLKDSDFFGMIQDSKGDYWFTTYGDGIVKFDGDRYTRYNEKNGLPDNRLFSVLEDHKGDLWFSTAGYGIVKFDGKKFTTYHDKGLGNLRVFKIMEDRRRDLWLATQSSGAVKYDGRRFIPISKQLGIDSDIVISVFEDLKGNIWMATVGAGVYRFTPDSRLPNSGEVFHHGRQTNLEASFIRTIEQDQNGAVWLGSASHGVIRIIDGDSVRYQYIGEKDGLKSNNVYLMKFDRQGHLWVGTEKGLDKIIFDEDYNIISIKNYQKQQGFVGIETCLNGVLEDKQGHLWFGTVSGVARYLPENDKPNMIPPKTHIKNIKLYYQDADLSPYSEGYDEDNMPVNLTLPHDKNHITFSFIGICMSNSEQVRYQFMLDGFDKTWSPIVSKNEAVYTSLPPGKYTFKVKACNDDMIWNESPRAYAFVISPPLWREPWFIAATLIGIFGFVFGGVRWRFYELQKAKQKLEVKVLERTVEITQQKEEIEKIKEEIEKKNVELELQNQEILVQRDILSQRKAEIENKNVDITASIAYAQRIQNAMLPNLEGIAGVFEDIFILFKPKAIVSGDFYWFSEKDGKYVIAAVDCTGHGIPGAFMAMIGDSLLSQIVNQNAILQPDEILKRLHEGVRDALNQQNNENTDGMDIALCVIDKNNKTLKFAGAKSPLVYFKDGESHFIKGDRNPIGAKIFDTPYSYHTHVIPLSEGMSFYIFTDGYQDQFGGEKDKKFMIKRLKTLLAKIHRHPFPEQKSMLNRTIEEWKSGRDQIDDILVIGFKII